MEDAGGGSGGACASIKQGGAEAGRKMSRQTHSTFEIGMELRWHPAPGLRGAAAAPTVEVFPGAEMEL